jgi:hypothetical protein
MPDERIETEIERFLQENGTTKEDLDLVLLGMNGDFPFDWIYRRLMDSFFTAKTGCAVYKPLCGEYYTSSAFALWLASLIISRQTVPASVSISPVSGNRIENILVYNHLRNVEHSLMLLSATSSQLQSISAVRSSVYFPDIEACLIKDQIRLWSFLFLRGCHHQHIGHFSDRRFVPFFHNRIYDQQPRRGRHGHSDIPENDKARFIIPVMQNIFHDIQIPAFGNGFEKTSGNE